MTFRFLARAVAGLAVSVSGTALASEVQKIDQGVVVTPDSGPAKRVRVVAYGDDIIRVTAVPGTDLTLPDSLIVVAKPHGASGDQRGRGRGHAEARQGERRDPPVRRPRHASATRRARCCSPRRRRAAFAPVSVEGKPLSRHPRSSSTAAPTKASTASASTRTGR